MNEDEATIIEMPPEDGVIVETAPAEAVVVETPPEPTSAEVKFKRATRMLRTEARKLRDSSGMTIGQIAKRAGVSSTTVSKATNPELDEDLKVGTLMSVLDACEGDVEFRVLKNGEPIQRTLGDVDIL